MDIPERLQKIISAAGIASRRKAEQLIREGRVSVNGQIVTELGTRADIGLDHIKVDGKLVRPPSQKVYILLNKPRAVMSTIADPQGRPKVTDLVRAKGKVYPVGRLDYNSEGLILLTNDGAFAKIVSGAGGTFPKTYQVKVRGIPAAAALNNLRSGCRLPDGTRLAPCNIRVLKEEKHAWLEVVLTEGKNREIRRMFEAIDHPVAKLRRTRIGFLGIEGLAIGRSRFLTPREIERIFRLGGSAQAAKRRDE